ncbi:MAG: glycoside hydrolase family 3 N-terminal domain-containing protein [Pseudomonadota bacterium]
MLEQRSVSAALQGAKISAQEHTTYGPTDIESRIAGLLSRMTLREKVGQLVQADASWGYPPDYLGDRLRAGDLGSVLNLANRDYVNTLQRIAVEESRLGIPLLVGRDVIHGFRHVMPIPLGQAASWDVLLVEQAARCAALEAARVGINWTFAPMIDIARDARWGRIAESPGEDPVLAGAMARAMVRGFQTDDLAAPEAVAACAKHFAAYGAVDGGRDYATTNVPRNELRNVYLPPFKAAVDAGVASVMTSFSDIDGVPASANDFLLRDVLRDEWQFDGMVVSDWDSVSQLSIHGLTADDRDAARQAIGAGVDMEMNGPCYPGHLIELVEHGQVAESTIDQAVANVLRLKFRLGLFERPFVDDDTVPTLNEPQLRAVARKLARNSVVMLKNDEQALPLRPDGLSRVALLGPLAHAPYQQLGTWVFDGDPELSITLRDALEAALPDTVALDYHRVMQHSRSLDMPELEAALADVERADVVILGLGEESILSGEAHCRANIDLPGSQTTLLRAVRAMGKPVIGVILAGRPLTLSTVIDEFDALLYAWHPGIEAGPALVDLLLGKISPSGKLPVSFPSVVGQIPIHYNHKRGGKPPSPDQVAHIDALDTRAPQTSVGMTSYYLDAGYEPLFPFGFGLSYGEFHYHDLQLVSDRLAPDATLKLSVELSNHGEYDAEEVVQVYVRDLVGSVTRPVRELKAFQRVHVPAASTCHVAFEIPVSDLGFYGRDDRWSIEPGAFQVWVGGDANAALAAEFEITTPEGGNP